jgi:hypothetical protein
MMRLSHWRTAMVIGVLAFHRLDAQSVPKVTCDATHTVNQCYTAVNEAAQGISPDKTKDSATTHQKTKLAAATTDPGAVGISNATAIRDFLPRLVAAVRGGVLSADDKKALGMKFGFPLYQSLVRDYGTRGQLESALNEAKLFSKISDAVPKAGHEKLADSLQKTLGDFDDITLSFAANTESRRWGRGWRQHADEVSQLVAEILEPLETELFKTFSAFGLATPGASAVDPARRNAAECLAADRQLSCFAPTVIADLNAKGLAYVKAATKFREQHQAVLKRFHFDRLGELLNNQPQFNATASYETRTKLVGPSVASGKLRIEGGRASLNALRGWCDAQRAAPDPKRRITADCLRGFIDRPEVAAALDASSRWWIAATGSYQQAYSFTLLADTINIQLPEKWTGGLEAGYGRFLGSGEKDAARARLDWQAGYSYTQGDPEKRHRVTSTLQLTQPFTDNTTSFIALKYANRPEFLDDVDHRLRANVGLSYKLVPMGAK